eukprot:TRINITY_DN727_c0_g1_i10.p1 TRINITY_DN727_c0_g1~~TRINITY_DN727_c0_g1_i10.p1  ORF type:complete len:123 (-),score=32.27 TRINITY_DN727_c0_g1_i10:691-1059(-)
MILQELGVFKEGAFRLAIEAGADILPVAIAGSHRALPKFHYICNPSVAVVTCGTPISTKASRFYSHIFVLVIVFVAILVAVLVDVDVAVLADVDIVVVAVDVDIAVAVDIDVAVSLTGDDVG